MNQGYDNALSSLQGEPGKYTQIKLLKQQFPAEISWLEGKPYRPISASLELLQVLARELRKGGRI